MFLPAIVILAFTNLGAASIAYGEKIIYSSVLRVVFLKTKAALPLFVYVYQHWTTVHSLCGSHLSI